MPHRFIEGQIWEADSIDEAAERELLIQSSSKAASNKPLPGFGERPSTLFHADLVDREFGSHLLSVAKLAAWMQGKGLELVTLPPIEGFQFVQVESLLCAIERAAFDGATEPQAAAVVQATQHLAHDRAAEVAPRWLVGADAHQQWRRLIEKAVDDGELALLHFGSKLPIRAVTEPQDQTPDPERRLARLRALGGNSKYSRGEWSFTGIDALVKSEESESRKRRSEKTIRADLKEAAQAERDAKAAGVFNGLGQR